MSNKTQAAALSVRGQNPQSLIEAIVRQKIYQNRYWKEKLPGLTAASIIDEALELEYISGTYGGTRKPSKFIMLALKLLQISPEKEEVMEYIVQEDYKYLTALGCFYLRLTASAQDVYAALEPLYQDFRKLRLRTIDGSFTIVHVDEFVDSLLNEEVYLDTILPHIQKRFMLEESNQLKPRVSPLEELLQEELLKEEEEKRKKEKEAEEENEKNKEQVGNKEGNDDDMQSRGRRNDKEKRRSESPRDRDRKRKSKRNYSSRHSSSSSKSSQSSSSSSSRESRRRRRNKHSDWRKVIRGKHNHSRHNHKRRGDHSESRSKSPSPKAKITAKEPAKDSVEYWNKIRADMGINLL